MRIRKIGQTQPEGYTEEEQQRGWQLFEEREDWESEPPEQAARRYFQLWTSTKGLGANPFIRANTPIRCTVWRYRKLRFETILFDYLLKDSEGLVGSYTRAFSAIYDELSRQAETDSELEKRLEQVDALLGRGEYEEESLEKLIRQQYEEAAGLESERDVSAAEDAVKLFYGALEAYPQLQKEFLSEIVDDTYTRFSDIVKRTGGWHTGTSSAGGETRSNKLLTFFFMEDPYPYLETIPVKRDGTPYTSPEELFADYPEGNTEETALPGQALEGGEKTFDQYMVLLTPDNDPLFIRNELNPDYQHVTISVKEAQKQSDARAKLRAKVNDLQKMAIFEDIYLAKNVLSENAMGFEDREEVPGISLLHLGREGEEQFDIPEAERDVTGLEDGGLFRVPDESKGVPKHIPWPERGKEKKKFTLKKKESWMAPSKDLFAQSLQERFAQEASMPALWIDDQGKVYDSQQELEAAYAAEDVLPSEEEIKAQIEQYVVQQLTIGAPAVAPTRPSPYQPVTPTAPEVQETYEPSEYSVTEEQEELPLAARQVMRLVRVANQLDKKGFHKEATMADQLASEIVGQLFQKVRTQTKEVIRWNGMSQIVFSRHLMVRA